MKNNRLGKNSLQKVPYELFAYINKHFSGGLLSKIRSTKNENNQDVFEVDISLEDTLYYLTFNSRGGLIKNESEPLLELYDEQLYDYR